MRILFFLIISSLCPLLTLAQNQDIFPFTSKPKEREVRYIATLDMYELSGQAVPLEWVRDSLSEALPFLRITPKSGDLHIDYHLGDNGLTFDRLDLLSIHNQSTDHNFPLLYENLYASNTATGDTVSIQIANGTDNANLRALNGSLLFSFNWESRDFFRNGKSLADYYFEKKPGLLFTSPFNLDDGVFIIGALSVVGGICRFDAANEDKKRGEALYIKYLQQVDKADADPIYADIDNIRKDSHNKRNWGKILVIGGGTLIAGVMVDRLIRRSRHQAFRDWLQFQPFYREQGGNVYGFSSQITF